MSQSTNVLAHATARLDVGKALRVLQTELRRRFGKDVSDVGQNTLSISPDGVVLTDEKCTIVARGHAKVATLMVRRRRKAK